MVGGVYEGFESYEEAIDLLPSRPIDDQNDGGHDALFLWHYRPAKGNIPPAAYRPVGCATWVDHPRSEPRLDLGPENNLSLAGAALHHAAPLHYNMIVLDTGGTSVIMEKFDAVRALELIERVFELPIASGFPLCLCAC